MKKKDIIWIIFILIIVVFQYNEIIFHKKIFFMRDLTYLFHPWKTAVSESLLKGNIPLWNPYSYCGMPLLANFQSAVFYPFSILFYVFGFINGLKLFTILHTFLGSLFVFLYFRNKKFKIMPSFTVGIIFSLGGYLITKIEFLSLYGTTIWLPLFLMLSLNSNIFIGALVFSFIIFAGYPPIIIFFLTLLFIEAFFDKKLKNILLILLSGLLVSSIQILPSIELILNSIRKSGLSITDTTVWSANFSDIISLISPIFLKVEQTGLFSGEKYFWLKSFWIGFIAAFMAILGIIITIFNKDFYLNRKKSIVYLCLVLFSLFFSLGSKTPIYIFIYKYIPVFNLIRYPAYILLIPFFIFIIYIATGLNNIKKASFLLTFLIVFELLIYTHKIHPTIEYNYYSEKGSITNFLQKDKDYFRFFLTPKTAWSEKIKIPDYGNIGWYILKDRLPGITSITSHLFDAGGIGEPIETIEHSRFINQIQLKNSADDANELLSDANVKYLLCDDIINSKFWKLAYKSHLFIYKNSNFVERSFVIDKNNKKRASNIIYYSPDKIKVETVNSGNLLFLDSYYPGWQAYINGKKSAIRKDNYIFRAITLKNSDKYLIHFLYRPILFTIGVLISLISICIIIICDILTFTGIQRS
ncbi:MAG: hypothetical protein A2539_04415 [Elusimicrobia bacterium RIFOXYD2_FULL_34_15]|nr:MAG: hypothetical protein A2539_04415 [Elusimicrobia bacterium RIFOXYD2_FULL_34_15]